MSQSVSRKRPWLAALLAALATGLGHLYLRRWRRALGWFAAVLVVTVVFVDPAAVESLARFESVDPMAVAPLLVVGALSVVDAYVLALAQNAAARLTAPSNGQPTHCPQCGRELDPDLDFCHWCTADVGNAADALPERPDAGREESARPERDGSDER
ncbi:MAG: zinc ribbon domain-containing protein [Haloarculaceae archaeon]